MECLFDIYMVFRSYVYNSGHFGPILMIFGGKVVFLVVKEILGKGVTMGEGDVGGNESKQDMF